MKVLVAEDDKFLMKVYSAKLSKEGFEVMVASDGEEALQKMRSSKPDIVLLDLIMPKKNGFDVLTEMKADVTLKEIPVVILSNLGQESDVQKVLLAGANDYIIKANISIDDVIKKIQKYGKAGQGITSTPKTLSALETSTEKSSVAPVDITEKVPVEKVSKPEPSVASPSVDLPKTTPPAQAENAAVASVSSFATCKSCKALLAAGSKFCAQCGLKQDA